MIGLGDEADMDCGHCEDISEEIKVKEVQKTNFDDGLTDLVLTTFVEHFSSIELVSYVYNPAFYSQYKPPLIDRDIPVLVQSFLI